MPFNRPPRILKAFSPETVEIPSPPVLPAKPNGFPWLTILLPLGATLLMVVLMVSFSGGGGSGLSMLLFLPMTLAGSLATYLSFRSQKKEFYKKQNIGKQDYALRIKKTDNHLYSLREREQTIRRNANPDLKECLTLAKKPSSRLGERRPLDPDFLSPRIGLGTLPSTVILKPPEVKQYPPELGKEVEFAKSLVEKFSLVPDVPVVGRLLQTGSVGIVGRRSEALDFTRSIICHLAVHHWFSEVQIAVLSEPKYLQEWIWVDRLPHASKAFHWQEADILFADPASSKVLLEMETELKRREQYLEGKKMLKNEEAIKIPPLPCLILVLDSFPQEFGHPGMDLLLKKGKELGVFALYITSDPMLTPGECGAILEIRGTCLSYKEAGQQGISIDCRPDLCDLTTAQSLAEALGKVDWGHKEDLSEPPSMISFLQMFGVQDAADLPVEQWWDGGSPFGYLQAPIGKTSATSNFIFDLRDQDGSHGPHGLLGGMTGSGKSEVLKTLILALAVSCHPHDLNFALVDYKGGAAFNELAKLPHTVGVMTDIESHASYAERVLMALTGEMERRKRILERARSIFRFGRSHVDDYRTMRIKQPLPHLVIVFDEFAEFKNKHPEESKRLISISRLGRSLGVHLILATQNIQAAIDPQIMQNSNFRVCLRTAQVDDSIQMIGIPDAIHLVRGRAFFYAQGRQKVQIAYCGGKCTPPENGDVPNPRLVILPNGQKQIISAPVKLRKREEEKPSEVSITEAHAIVDRLNEAMRALMLPKPDPVWSDPLPDRVYLTELLKENITGGWDGDTWQTSRKWGVEDCGNTRVDPILGLCDLPLEQKQPLRQLSFEENGGNILIFGAAQSGKTTLLKTLAVSIALTFPPNGVQIHILDFSNQTDLKALEAFPHVGSVISRFELERTDRLLRHAKTELQRRNELFQKAGVGTIADFNKLKAGPASLPEIFLFIDNFLALKRSLDTDFVNQIASLVSGGSSTGIHLAVATFSPGDLPADLISNVNQQVTFHQSSAAEYFSIVGAIPEARVQEDLGRPPRPGRGFFRGTMPIEFQAALPTGGENDQEQLQQIMELSEKMQKAWTGIRPHGIENLPYSICLPKADGMEKNGPPFVVAQGMDFETLEPLGLTLEKDGSSFLITSSAGQSGKTTALITWILGLAERYSPQEIQFIFIDFHTKTLSPMKKLPHQLAYINNPREVEPSLNHLLTCVKQRAMDMEEAYQKDPDNFERDAFLAKCPMWIVAVDDYDRFASQCESERRLLEECLTAGRELGLCFFIAGNANDLPRDYDDPFLQKTRRQGNGLLFSGNAAIDQFNNAKSPPYQPMAGMPAGRGYLIRKGQVRIFQNYHYWEEGRKPADCLQERIETLQNQYRPFPPLDWPAENP